MQWCRWQSDGEGSGSAVPPGRFAPDPPHTLHQAPLPGQTGCVMLFLQAHLSILCFFFLHYPTLPVGPAGALHSVLKQLMLVAAQGSNKNRRAPLLAPLGAWGREAGLAWGFLEASPRA